MKSHEITWNHMNLRCELRRANDVWFRLLFAGFGRSGITGANPNWKCKASKASKASKITPCSFWKLPYTFFFCRFWISVFDRSGRTSWPSTVSSWVVGWVPSAVEFQNLRYHGHVFCLFGRHTSNLFFLLSLFVLPLFAMFWDVICKMDYCMLLSILNDIF